MLKFCVYRISSFLPSPLSNFQFPMDNGQISYNSLISNFTIFFSFFCDFHFHLLLNSTLNAQHSFQFLLLCSFVITFIRCYTRITRKIENVLHILLHLTKLCQYSVFRNIRNEIEATIIILQRMANPESRVSMYQQSIVYSVKGFWKDSKFEEKIIECFVNREMSTKIGNVRCEAFYIHTSNLKASVNIKVIHSLPNVQLPIPNTLDCGKTFPFQFPTFSQRKRYM